MREFAWSAESEGKRVTLRNGRGGRHPEGKPYLLLVYRVNDRPLARMWLSRTDLATLTSELSREMGIRPISDIIMGGKLSDQGQQANDRRPGTADRDSGRQG